MPPKKSNDRVCDWKQYPKRSWPYDGIDDPKYLQDRSELFHTPDTELAPFNGWWYFVPNKVSIVKTSKQKMKTKRRRNKNGKNVRTRTITRVR